MSEVTVVSGRTSKTRTTPYLARARQIVDGGRAAQARRFQSIMRVADKIGLEDPEGLHGLIKLLGRIVQGRALASWIDRGENIHFTPASALFDCNGPLDGNGQTLNDLKKELDEAPQLTLSHDILLPWPWDPPRVVNSMCNLRPDGKWGEWQQDYENHCVELWLPWRIGWVHGGNHSICAGIAYGTGSIKADLCFDIRPVYEHVECDGLVYRRITDKSVIAPVSDLELAAIFEIGRKLRRS